MAWGLETLQFGVRKGFKLMYSLNMSNLERPLKMEKRGQLSSGFLGSTLSFLVSLAVLNSENVSIARVKAIPTRVYQNETHCYFGHRKSSELASFPSAGCV